MGSVFPGDTIVAGKAGRHRPICCTGGGAVEWWRWVGVVSTVAEFCSGFGGSKMGGLCLEGVLIKVVRWIKLRPCGSGQREVR